MDVDVINGYCGVLLVANSSITNKRLYYCLSVKLQYNRIKRLLFVH